MDWPAGTLEPPDRLALANRLAALCALDPEIRQQAARLVRQCSDVPKQLPARAARFIRKHYLYMMDPPGVELLQGARSFRFTGGGDCDCLAIYWTAIVRAAGLTAWVGGVVYGDRMPHAVGVGWDGRCWELSDATRYGGSVPPLRFTVPKGARILVYRPEPGSEGFAWVERRSPWRRATVRRVPPWWIALGLACMVVSNL